MSQLYDGLLIILVSVIIIALIIKTLKAFQSKRIKRAEMMTRRRMRNDNKVKQLLTAKIQSYPEWKMTQQEFDSIQQVPPDSIDFFKTCPLGTIFVCNDFDITSILVIGQIVEGTDLLTAQWGAGIGIPSRGINRYRVKIVSNSASISK